MHLFHFLIERVSRFIIASYDGIASLLLKMKEFTFGTGQIPIRYFTQMSLKHFQCHKKPLIGGNWLNFSLHQKMKVLYPKHTFYDASVILKNFLVKLWKSHSKVFHLF